MSKTDFTKAPVSENLKIDALLDFLLSPMLKIELDVLDLRRLWEC